MILVLPREVAKAKTSATTRSGVAKSHRQKILSAMTSSPR
jgi:hypothetical protein